MATKTKPILRLVKFKGDLFPADKDSFHSMKESNLTVFRIASELLPTLQASVLKRFKVEQIPFSVVFTETLESFQKLRLVDLPNHRWKTESNVLYLSFPSNQLELGNQMIHELGFVLGRYGVKLQRDNRTDVNSEGKPERQVVRLTCLADSEINPSVYWRDAIPFPEEDVRLNLSSCTSLVFTSRPSLSHPGRLALGVAFEDYLGEEWVQAFSREFGLATLKTDQVIKLLNHLVHVTNLSKTFKPPVTPPTRRTR